MNLLRWDEAPEDWMRKHGFMEWLCRCGAEVRVEWATSDALYDDPDEPITPAGPITSSWSLTCLNGHTLLVCAELADDESADTFEPPTVRQIVERLASEEDIAAWLAYKRPMPPWDGSDRA